MATNGYKQYIMLLDPNDPEEKELIDYLKKKHTNKHKGSYSAILRSALKIMLEIDKKTV